MDHRKPTRADEPAADTPREGDILGLSDTPDEVEIPQAAKDRGGHPAGIEVRGHTRGTGHLKQSSGATAIDMGAGGSGNTIAEDQSGPRSAKPDRS